VSPMSFVVLSLSEVTSLGANKKHPHHASESGGSAQHSPNLGPNQETSSGEGSRSLLHGFTPRLPDFLHPKKHTSPQSMVSRHDPQTVGASCARTRSAPIPEDDNPHHISLASFIPRRRKTSMGETGPLTWTREEGKSQPGDGSADQRAGWRGGRFAIFGGSWRRTKSVQLSPKRLAAPTSPLKTASPLPAGDASPVALDSPRANRTESGSRGFRLPAFLRRNPTKDEDAPAADSGE